MRILIDTNILFSAILFPNSKLAKTVLYITSYHEVVLCDLNLFELREVLKRKHSDKLPDAEVFMAELSYELIPAVYHTEKLIRDAKDQPILNAAIIADVDIILTGDKDFLCLEMEHPKCMSIADFTEYENLEL
jgi:putative PIN family toxin of toxin-antitoxin system